MLREGRLNLADVVPNTLVELWMLDLALVELLGERPDHFVGALQTNLNGTRPQLGGRNANDPPGLSVQERNHFTRRWPATECLAQPVTKPHLCALFRPNDEVQQRGRPQRLHAAERRDAGPICCNVLFG